MAALRVAPTLAPMGRVDRLQNRGGCPKTSRPAKRRDSGPARREWARSWQQAGCRLEHWRLVDGAHDEAHSTHGTPRGARGSLLVSGARGDLHPARPPVCARATITGPLAYRSEATRAAGEEEEAILVAAATGITGVVREEWPFPADGGEATGGDKLASFTGRSYPSPLAIHGTELFWTNDEGVFVLPQRDLVPERYIQLQTQEERTELYRRAIKLQDGRLEIPRRRPNLFGFNNWLANTDGATLFIPVSDVTRSASRRCCCTSTGPTATTSSTSIWATIRCAPFVESGLLDPAHRVDLWDFERWQMVDMNGVEQGLMVQNLMIATQALGIGGHPFSGGKGRVTLGGERQWHAIGGKGPCGSLGFGSTACPTMPRWAPARRSRSGSRDLRRRVPAFHADMDAAVDFVLDLRWGAEGIFSAPERRPIPWRSPEVAHAVPRPSEKRSRRPRRCAATSGTPTGASRRRSTRS